MPTEPANTDNKDFQFFNVEEVLQNTSQAYVDHYKKRINQGTIGPSGIHHKRKNLRRSPNQRLSDETITSYRAACCAKDEGNFTITYTELAKMHKIIPSWAAKLRKDWTTRPTCIPTADLIEKFKEQFAVGAAQVRYIKAVRKDENIRPEDIPAIRRARRVLKWNELLKFFKRSFGEFPQEQITALVMLEELYRQKCMTQETAAEAITLIHENLIAFSGIVEYVDEEEN